MNKKKYINGTEDTYGDGRINTVRDIGRKLTEATGDQREIF